MLIRDRLLRAPDDAGGGAGSDNSGGSNGGNASGASGSQEGQASRPLSIGKTAGLTAGDQAALAASKSADALPDGWAAMEKRPDWLPERFYDSEKKAARFTDLAKSYTEAEKKLFTRTDDLRRQVEREFEEGRMKARPEKPEAYQAKLPDGFKIEGIEYKPDENNAMLKWWRGAAHGMGLSQSQFEEGIKSYVEQMAADLPDVEAELKKLGDRGPERLTNLAATLEKQLGADAWAALKPLATTAPIIEALEKLTGAKIEAISPGQGGRGAEPLGDTRTNADLQAMMRDPRYADPFKRDAAFVREVEALNRKLHG